MNIEQPKLLGGIIDYCTGCKACEQICPHGAITMQADEEDFWSLLLIILNVWIVAYADWLVRKTRSQS